MCIGPNVRFMPMNMSQKFTLPHVSLSMLPEDLRPPVVEAGEEPEHRATEEHVVEVGDDVVGVGLLRVGRRDRVGDAREAADREEHDEPDREHHRHREPQSTAPHRARAS